MYQLSVFSRLKSVERHVLEQAERADISPELRDAVRANPRVDWIDVPPPVAAAAVAQSDEQQLPPVQKKKVRQDPSDRARAHPLEVWQSFLGGRSWRRLGIQDDESLSTPLTRRSL